MIVAIDGPAASGKSTVARALARRCGFSYLDTGAMYRAVALAALESDVPLHDASGLAALAATVRIEFAKPEGEELPLTVLLDGHDVSADIRTPRVDAAVSAVAREPAVRSILVRKQRERGAEGDIVVEGRDIGTVVFPDAPVKVYLTADERERAKRRHLDMEIAGHDILQEAVHDRLVVRDAKDSTRRTSPLAVAKDAVKLDTTALTVDEVVDRIAALVEGAR